MPRVNPIYSYKASPDQFADKPTHHPVIIVGAGPAGLCTAVDLALQGIKSLVLDDNNTVSVGSRAICFAKRTLEICDRYKVADRMLAKGVSWQVGRVFWRDELIYNFDLLPESEHKMPAFINLQQYYFEEYFVDRCEQLEEVEIRWLSRVSNIRIDDAAVYIDVSTEGGTYSLSCDYLLAADGANSSVRQSLGLAFRGQIFEDHFLIADIVMHSDFPVERRFWFDASFHPGKSTLLHKQPDNLWRIDFQLGQDADPELENRPDNVIARVDKMFGDEKLDYDLEWSSVYTFCCRKLDSFIHQKRVIFIGDSAHQVSPFGARGGNGAIQAVDNLSWKLAAVLGQSAPSRLLYSYDQERQCAARENITCSTRSTDFMTPKNTMSEFFQFAVLSLAKDYPFARSLVNSGRLSTPSVYSKSLLNTQDRDDFSPLMRPGSPCADAPVMLGGESKWLLDFLGNRFVCILYIKKGFKNIIKKLYIATQKSQHMEFLLVTPTACPLNFTENIPIIYLQDNTGLVRSRYDLCEGSVYLIRPDQHVCARWRCIDSEQIIEAQRRALGYFLPENHEKNRY